MKALTIWEPWASLIAVGAKRYETRSWPTAYRGPIAIHAGRTWNSEIKEACADSLIADRLSRLYSWPIQKSRLPLGCIVAVGFLAEVIRTDDLPFQRIDTEFRFGNFMPGRWAWRIEYVERFKEPLHATGRQGLWDIKTYGNGGQLFEAHLQVLRENNSLIKVGWE
jgi:activating signal cointegrator 1